MCDVFRVVQNCNKVTRHGFREFAPEKNQVFRKFPVPSTHAKQNNLAAVTTHTTTRVIILLMRDAMRVSFSQRARRVCRS